MAEALALAGQPAVPLVAAGRTGLTVMAGTVAPAVSVEPVLTVLMEPAVCCRVKAVALVRPVGTAVLAAGPV